MIAQAVLWMVIGFISGSLMLAYWVGRLALRRDVREVGDGNPGATNVIKAGGVMIGGLALLLDILKGAIPVGIAYWLVGIRGAVLIPVALAPVFGHAYSPFLNFRGGKAVAVTAGVWMALTAYEFPMFGGLMLGLWFAIVERSGWAVLLTGTCLAVYYLFIRQDAVLSVILLINFALILWKYRADLRQPPGLRGWLRRRLPSSA